MSGLRERQKEMRRQAIVDAALLLFEKQGFQTTTVEQIAAEAGVSAPTVFNYFGTKQHIILDLIRSTDEATFVEAEGTLESIDDPLDALCFVEYQGTVHTLQALPLAVWREVLPLMFTPGSVIYDAYQELVRAFLREAGRMVNRLIERGLLRRDLDGETCIQMLMDISHMHLIRLVDQPVPDLEEHRQYVRRLIKLLLQGVGNNS
ncbi:TetR/AcrR family transcriptional regulator [Pseudomonas chlororaphis]|uniref:TetR/AcrR family transcriptional regulator n=1 Tax=Pseudomonas chlororaphis TaxID=587753 RepID=UPI0004710749|nr:TetR/AcrR family transcriptional regulator [Pseudomonas chlororaphis]